MSEFNLFYDIKYLIFVLAGTGGLMFVSFSPKEILLNLKLALNGRKASDEMLNRGKDFWTGSARNAFLFGAVGVLIKLLHFFQDVTAEGSSGISNITTTIAYGIHPMVFGRGLGCGLMTLAWRTGQKTENSHKTEGESSSHPLLWKITGSIIMIGAFGIVCFDYGIGKVFISLPLGGMIFGGTLFVYFLSRNKSSVTPALGILGFIVVLLGISKILFAMGHSNMGDVAAAMISSLVALFYSLLGILFAGIPLDDHQLRLGKPIPLINKAVYIFVFLITLAIYLFMFIMIITPVTKK